MRDSPSLICIIIKLRTVTEEKTCGFSLWYTAVHDLRGLWKRCPPSLGKVYNKRTRWGIQYDSECVFYVIMIIGKGMQFLLSLLIFVLSQPVSVYRSRKRVNHAEFWDSEGVQVSWSDGRCSLMPVYIQWVVCLFLDKWEWWADSFSYCWG